MPAHAAAAHRVVTTPELAPFAGIRLDRDVNGGPDGVDWSWIATADVSEVAASPRSARNARWCPARKD